MKKGRVIESTGSWYKVDTGNEIIKSRLPGKFRLEDKKHENGGKNATKARKKKRVYTLPYGKLLSVP